MPSRVEERQLVSRILDGDNGAFEELVHGYKGVVFGTLRRFRQLTKEDADDLFQAVFQRLLENDQRALRAWEESPLAAYLKRITHNIALDFLRRPQTELFDPDEDPNESITQPLDNPGPDAEILVGELRRMMQEAIRCLSAADQDIVRLLYFEELSYSQMAETLGISITNTGVRISRARNRLAAVVRNEFPALLEYF